MLLGSLAQACAKTGWLRDWKLMSNRYHWLIETSRSQPSRGDPLGAKHLTSGLAKTLFQPSRLDCQPFRARQSGLFSIETQKLPCTHRERRRHVQDVHASMSALRRVSC